MDLTETEEQMIAIAERESTSERYAGQREQLIKNALMFFVLELV